MSESDYPEASDVADEILAYLRTHPRAADTLDGVVQWWLIRSRYLRGVQHVQEALQLLIEQGNVTEKVLPGDQVLPLRLHYLITPIVRNSDTGSRSQGMDQLLIGKVLQVFNDVPQLAGNRLRGSLTGTGRVIHVRLEPLPLAEIANLWDAMKRPYQLCVAYEVSVTLVASDAEPAQVPSVDVVVAEQGLIGGANQQVDGL